MILLPTNINEVIIHLENIVNSAMIENNRMGYFATLYLRVTIEIRDKINEEAFENAELVEQLDVVFANRFLEAYYNYQAKGSVTNSWQVAFDATNHWNPLVIQHLFLGMNAHIGLDLGLATAIVCKGKSIYIIKNDFNSVNTILASLVDAVQDCLASIWPMLKIIDRFSGKVDEGLANFSIQIARDAAWQTALDYFNLSDSAEQDDFIKSRDASVSEFSKNLQNPGLYMYLIAKLIRITEFGTIKSKIKKLTLNITTKTI